MEINAISTLKFRFSEIKNIPLPFSEILVSKSCRFFQRKLSLAMKKVIDIGTILDHINIITVDSAKSNQI